MELDQSNVSIENLRDVLSEAVLELEKKFRFAQAYFSEDQGLSLSVAEKETKVNEVPSRRGVVLSVFNGSYFVEYASSICTKDNILKITSILKSTIPMETEKYTISPGEPWSGSFESSYRENPFAIPLETKLDHLMQIRKILASAGSRIVAANVRYGEKVVRKIYVNRNKKLSQTLLQTLCVPVVIASDGVSTKVLHGGNGRQEGFEVARISEHDLVKLAEDTEKLLGAVQIGPGIYDIVCGPPIVGVIAHEAFGHGVEADMFLKQRAKAVEYLNHEVASPLVNLFDSPCRPGLSGSYFFDDEGMKAGETCIIENGILKHPLTDRRSSILLNIAGTANGRRESYANKIYTRMSNTYFGTQNDTVDEMIGSIDYGLYMPKGSNGMEDPMNWGIQVESPYAIEIKNGRLTNRIFSPIVITGFVPDLLKSISMVGADLDFEGMGICQKGHKEQVMVAIGGPHMKMRARVG